LVGSYTMAISANQIALLYFFFGEGDVFLEMKARDSVFFQFTWAVVKIHHVVGV